MSHNHPILLNDWPNNEPYEMPESYKRRLEEERKKPKIIDYMKKCDAWFTAHEEWHKKNPNGVSTIEDEREYKGYLKWRMKQILEEKK